MLQDLFFVLDQSKLCHSYCGRDLIKTYMKRIRKKKRIKKENYLKTYREEVFQIEICHIESRHQISNLHCVNLFNFLISQLLAYYLHIYNL